MLTGLDIQLGIKVEEGKCMLTPPGHTAGLILCLHFLNTWGVGQDLKTMSFLTFGRGTKLHQLRKERKREREREREGNRERERKRKRVCVRGEKKGRERER